MTPIKVPLPPLGQISGPLTQGQHFRSSPPALHCPRHHQEAQWSSRAQDQGELEEAAAAGADSSRQGQRDNDLLGLWDYGLALPGTREEAQVTASPPRVSLFCFGDGLKKIFT